MKAISLNERVNLALLVLDSRFWSSDILLVLANWLLQATCLIGKSYHKALKRFESGFLTQHIILR